MTVPSPGVHSAWAAHPHGLLKKLIDAAKRLIVMRAVAAMQDTQESSPFAELMAEVMATADSFGHREHVHLTWLAVRRYDTTAAVELVSDGIQRTARYAKIPWKYNATVSRAWVELVGHYARQSGIGDFDAFVDERPELLGKKLLTRFYRSSTLASPAARTGWGEPDIAPMPQSRADNE
ncbi:hypothetical protein [Mycobacterium sp. HUMS_1102779]|uniref:hypothetical protein n=1 Tax=Mycobacterium sp. HUMS_1102779 TaxID=3383487 RepID=UPI00389A2062